MGDTVITMDDGGRFYPSSSTDSVQCSSCDNVVDTPSEVASYPDGDALNAVMLGRQRQNVIPV